MTHGSLSSGIGGMDIGAAANGIETSWTSEIDPVRQDVLKYLLPNAIHYGDMREIKKTKKVDIISFGFPCQDISTANPNGKGLEGAKSSLFYEGWRIICQNRPKYIVIENSPNLVNKGLREILIAFAKEGYNAEWHVISCKQFGMPHLRKRLFIVATDTNQKRCKAVDGIFGEEHKEKLRSQTQWKIDGSQIIFQPESYRGASWQDWAETIRSFSHLDDGIPKNILYGLLAATGDTVSPVITSWLFGQIKKAEENC
jgi:DNA (cytosine-5)-methyltransferase 1